MSDDDLPPGADGVTLLVNLGHAFPSFYEDGSCTGAGVPGEAEVGLQGPDRWDVEQHTFSAQVEGQSECQK